MNPSRSFGISGRSTGTQTPRRWAPPIVLLVMVTGAWFIVVRSASQSIPYPQLDITALAPLCKKDDVRACNALGKRAVETQKIAVALNPLQQCLDRVRQGHVTPPAADTAELAGYLAMLKVLSGKADDAGQLAAAALQVSEASAPAHLAAALVEAGQGQDNQALYHLDRVKSLDTSSGMAWSLTGSILRREGQLDTARDAAKKAVLLTPSNVGAWRELGDCYRASMEYQAALKAYQQELTLDPESSQAATDVAMALARTANSLSGYQAAMTRLNRALRESAGSSGELYTLRGDIQLKLGRVNEAADSYRLAMRADPTVPDTYPKVAQALALSGDRTRAEQYRRKYREMYFHFQQVEHLVHQVNEWPDDPERHRALARAWQYYHAWPEIIREYQEVQRLRPGDKEARQNLAGIPALSSHGMAAIPTDRVLAHILRDAQLLRHSAGA